MGLERYVKSIAVEVEDIHGGVYGSLIDTSMGLSVMALVGVRTATIQMNVHFLGAVNEGLITCESEVVRRTRHGRGEGPRRGGQSRRHRYRPVPRFRAEG